MMLPLISVAATASLANALGLYEPADGKIIWGAWVDTENGSSPNAIGVGGDSPSLFNSRLGLNAGVFHMSQSIPLAISPFDQTQQTAPLGLLESTKTDAILFLTVYPNQTAANPYALITDNDIQLLAYQVSNITDPTKSARRVLLRFAPEMNGNWFTYGQQPTLFKQTWIKIVTAIRAVTKRVAFVWSPNAANNYPFGNPLPNAETSALDTNGDKAFDINDDPFTPYFPGTDYVDWVGISLYWKGNPAVSTPPHDNSASPSDYWEQMVQGGPDGSNTAYPFYTMFAQKYNLPLVMSEGGAAFALTQGSSTTALDKGVGEATILQTFWRSYLNPTFFGKYPKAKMFINFEYVKIKEDSTPGQDNGVTRDYRITFDSATLQAFQADMKNLAGSMQWSVPFVAGTDPLVIGGGQTPQNGGGSSSGTAGSSGGSGSPVSTGNNSGGSSSPATSAPVSATKTGGATKMVISLAFVLCVMFFA